MIMTSILTDTRSIKSQGLLPASLYLRLGQQDQEQTLMADLSGHFSILMMEERLLL